jgi:hypothetical protein
MSPEAAEYNVPTRPVNWFLGISGRIRAFLGAIEARASRVVSFVERYPGFWPI